jgi:predicted nicotinamide N-methyase
MHFGFDPGDPTCTAGSGEYSERYRQLMLKHKTLRTVRRAAGPADARRELIVVESVLGGYGAKVWPAAASLADFLDTGQYFNTLPPDRLRGLRGRTVLELGAGVGLVGLVAAMHGAHVVLTDAVPDLLDAMRANANTNAAAVQAAGGSITVLPLYWGDKAEIEAVVGALPAGRGGGFDLILGADLLYAASSFGVLFTTLRSCSRPPTPTTEGTTVLLAYPDREDDNNGLGGGLADWAPPSTGMPPMVGSLGSQVSYLQLCYRCCWFHAACLTTGCTQFRFLTHQCFRSPATHTVWPSATRARCSPLPSGRCKACM